MAEAKMLTIEDIIFGAKETKSLDKEMHSDGHSLKRSSIFEVGVKAGQWVDQSCQDSKQKDELVISGWDSKLFLMAIGHYRIL